MFASSRRRPLICIALFAWLAQLCLPAAHAAVMARHDAAVSGWCGNFSAAMAAKVAALPEEIRDIIAPGSDAHASMQAECLLLCAGSVGVAMPAAIDIGASMPLPLVERPIALAAANPQILPTPRPPPRGPPLNR